MRSGDGDEDLGDQRKKSSGSGEPPTKRAARRPRADGGAASRAGEVGKALRVVYDSTLHEQVPDDFLNLLGKLR